MCAKVIGPLHSTKARGSVGAIIFNTWRGIRTVKRMTSPSQPRTSRQLAIRSMLVGFVRAWRGLSAVNIAAWNAWAAIHPVIDWTGIAKRLTGCNCYCALNMRLLDMGKNSIEVPPATAPPAGVDALVATGGAGQVSLAFTASGGTATTIDVWLTGIMSKGVQAKIEKVRHHSYAPGETTPLVITDLIPGYYTVFCRHIDELSGQVSAWVSDTFTVT